MVKVGAVESTVKTFCARVFTAIPKGLSKLAAVPTPSTIALVELPARVVTTPAGVIFLILLPSVKYKFPA